MRSAARPETEIAASAIRYFRDLGWDTYQEVSTGYGEPRCDIVARLGSLLWACECKDRLSFDVIHQAARWVGHANRVSVCVGRLPRGPFRYGPTPLKKYMEWLGIGVLVSWDRGDPAEQIVGARLSRRIGDGLRRHLAEEQRDWCAAGSPSGGYYTPFAKTARDLLSFVNNHPGCCAKEAIAGIKHHYGSDTAARHNLIARAESGVIHGIRVVRDGKRITFHPAVELAT